MKNRIAVIGNGGAGKSTLAMALGEILRLPVIHLDSYFWLPGWKERERKEWEKLHATLLERPEWIMDGNYGALMAPRLAAADTIIWLDFPRHICLWRAVRRWWWYGGRQRPDMGAGCPEKIDWEFIQWIWNFPRFSRPQIVDRLRACGPHKQVVALRRPHQAQHWLNRLKRTAG